MLKEEWISNTEEVDIDTRGYSFESVMNNKNCSKHHSYWRLIKKTKFSDAPEFLFQSKTGESWQFFDPNIVNPISNTNQIYIKFKNVSEFVEPSNHFRTHGCYTSYTVDTVAWNKYWDDLEDKIENGFEVDGVRITGRYFFTINFGRFRAVPVDEFGKPTSRDKKWTFLRFLDHQYYMMNELEHCLLEGPFKTIENFKKWFPNKNADDFEKLGLESFVLAKARRKGWTAAIAVGIFNYNFTFIESSMNIIAAYEKGKYGAMLKSFHTTKTFLDKYTPWKRRTDIKGTNEHMISGVEVKDDYGIILREGYLSEIQALSFKDNEFKSVGESSSVINIEEAGIFQDLVTTFQASVAPLIRDGETKIGIAIVGGSAGDMSGGGSTGLAEMIYKPEAYGFKAYPNIYETVEVPGNTGWFVDDLWYSPIRMSKKEILEIDNSEKTVELLSKFKGEYIDFVDNHGNSYRYLSNLFLERKRESSRRISSMAYQMFITQQPKYLSEAFLLNESSPFDTATAKEVLGQLMIQKIGEEKGIFSILDGRPNFKLDMSLNAVDEYPYRGEDTTGCWVLYERPQEIGGKIPTWRYIAGNDPIDWGSDEVSTSGYHSFAATYIIDTVTRNIVAEYIGRPYKADNYFEQLWRGLEYYNAFLLYENNLKSLFTYFKLKNKLYLLAQEPGLLKDRLGYKSNNRPKGFHATPESNRLARELIHTWSLEQVMQSQTEDGENIYVPRMYYIKSKGLLQEIINYNSKGNFDRVSGFGAAMLLLFDRNYDEDDFKETNSFMNQGIFAKVKSMINKKNKFNLVR
ncbi:MAG: hypothetical protein M0R17_04550 [Candidatus Omnitrophica bacterium]|jgi:hypothetical protein|nr:hypothetical protein [Candidatus Omnitrophota bacterium]